MADVHNNYGLKRLQSKTAKNAIVQKLSTDFNLTPIIAEAYYQQFDQYYQEHTNISLFSGEICYETVANYGLAGIRRYRIARLTRQAYDMDVLLSNEAVDRYIKDYHRVELLWNHNITDLDQIYQLSRLSKRVA